MARISSLSEKTLGGKSRRLTDWLNLAGEKKVHSLVDKVYKMKNLALAWEKVKTHVVDATETCINFLGFTIQMSRGAKTGKPYPNVRSSDKSLKTIKARLTELTRRELTVTPLSDIVGNVNRSLRGWVNYFHYRNSSQAMGKVRSHAEERLRIHLRKRHKVKNRRSGWVRFPPADLYGRYGLYQTPTVAGWRSVHASS